VAPALAAGSIVISDRSYYSSLAYQGGARGLGIDVVRTVNEAGLRGIVPDRVVLLRIAAERGLAREAETDRISAEGVELQRRVAAAYDAIIESDPGRFLVVDATRSIDSIVGEVLALFDGAE